MPDPRRIAVLVLPLCAALALTSCGPPQPMTQARAERLCAQEVRAADGVTGQVGVGGGSDGPFAGGTVTVTNRVANPIPPEQALAACSARVLAGGRPDPTAGATIGISIGGNL